MNQVRAKIAGRSFVLTPRDTEELVSNMLPEPLDDHYVVIAGKRFPPKQVISLITGLDRADFNTHQARHILRKLGFVVGRRNREMSVQDPNRPGPHQGREADLLRPFMGQWVAQRGLDVLVAADTPQEVLAWLERHNQRADVMFRVPRDETEASGAAPL
jgi:hypothetical protein